MRGSNLAGSSNLYDREQNDFYATDPESVRKLLEIADIKGDHFFEPCVGQGHIANVLKEFYPEAQVLGSDIVDRGYPETRISDYIASESDIETDWIITNPPYSQAREFIEKALTQTRKGVAMFLKIQFLEGQKRKAFLEQSPLKYVYVFSGRQDPFRNGLEKNPHTGKKWGGTMCFAWFVWENDHQGDPIIKWI